MVGLICILDARDDENDEEVSIQVVAEASGEYSAKKSLVYLENKELFFCLFHLHQMLLPE